VEFDCVRAANYCAYAAADLAGARRMQYPPNVRVVHVPCTGKIEREHILGAFESKASPGPVLT